MVDSTMKFSIVFMIDEQFFLSKIEISRLNGLNTNCMENMAWVIKDLWYVFFSSTFANKDLPLDLHIELMLTVTHFTAQTDEKWPAFANI